LGTRTGRRKSVKQGRREREREGEEGGGETHRQRRTFLEGLKEGGRGRGRRKKVS